MNDIQQVEKINAMSQELKNFGFVEDSTQGVESAAGILMNDEEQKQSAIFTNEEEVIVNLSNNFKRFKDMTAIRMQEMSKEIINLHGQVKDLIQTISSLQGSLPARIESPPRENPIPQEPVKVKQENPEAKHESQETSKPYNEMQGHYHPDNVKIEDFFYFGQK